MNTGGLGSTSGVQNASAFSRSKGKIFCWVIIARVIFALSAQIENAMRCCELAPRHSLFVRFLIEI